MILLKDLKLSLSRTLGVAIGVSMVMFTSPLMTLPTRVLVSAVSSPCPLFPATKLELFISKDFMNA